MNDIENIVLGEIKELRKDVIELKVAVARLKLIAGGFGACASVAVSVLLKVVFGI